MALEWERAAEAGRSGVLTESASRKVLSDLHEQTSGKPLTFYTVEGWVNEWLSNRAGTAAPRTLERYSATCRDFLKFLQDRAKLSLGALTSTDLRKYRDALRGSGHSATTCNQSLKIMSSPLEYARKLGLIAINPVHGVSPLKDTARHSREAFTINEIRTLLETVKGTDWEGCTMLGAFCGLRLRDAANLTWDSVDLGNSMLNLETGKTGTAIAVPLHADLLAWLKKRTRGIGKAPVLPALYGKSGSGKSGLSMAFKRHMEKAGVLGRVARKGSGEHSLCFGHIP
jgi:integrase